MFLDKDKKRKKYIKILDTHNSSQLAGIFQILSLLD